MAANSRHLKRHSMPVSWSVKRKNVTFIAKPNPGSFKRDYVTSVIVLLRDVLEYVKTSKEAKYILNNKELLVNSKPVSDIKSAVGIFDVVEIKKTEEKFIVLFNELGKIKLVKTKDSNLYLKVSSKSLIAGKKFQINFMNGYNLLVDEKTFKSVSVNDTIVYDSEKKKVLSTIKMKESNFVYIFDGHYKGKFGIIKSFISYNGLARDVVEIELGKELHTTAKDYCFAVAEKKEDLKRFE